MLRVRSERRLKRSGIGLKKCAYRSVRAATAKCSGEASLRPTAGLLEAPLLHLRVIPRLEHLGNLPPPVSGRTGVVRILGRALERRAVGLLDRALGVAEGTRQLSEHGVGDHHRGQLTPGEHVAAD